MNTSTNQADEIVQKTAQKALEYLDKGIPAVGADGVPIMDEGEPVRKAPGAADLRAYLAVADACDKRANSSGNSLGSKIRDQIAAVKLKNTPLRLTGTDNKPSDVCE